MKEYYTNLVDFHDSLKSLGNYLINVCCEKLLLQFYHFDTPENFKSITTAKILFL